MLAEADLSAHAALVAGEGHIATGIAETLAGCGCRVLLATPSPPAAAAIECAPFDGMDEAEWPQIIDRILQQAGSFTRRFDIMVNARLTERRCSLQDLSLEQFRAHNRQVLHATFLGVRFAANAMRAHGGGGSIINVTGLDSRMPLAGSSASASSDGGIRMLTKAAALELGPEGIRVNTVQCDLAKPSRRANVQDVAKAVAFLASGRSRFMTGADVLIDGGRLAGV